MLTTCPICDYSLDGLPDRHSCPECGFEYDKSMTPFDGLRKRHMIPGYLRLLIIALSLPALAILIQIDPQTIWPYIVPTILIVPPLVTAMREWLNPERYARLIFLAEKEIVIIPTRGKPLRFKWAQIGRAEKSRIHGAVRIVDNDNNQVASLHRRSFTTDWFAGRLVEQINGRIEAQRRNEGSPVH